MSSKRLSLLSIIGIVFTTAVVFLPNVSPWLSTPVVLVGFVFTLGLLLSVNVRMHTESLTTFVLYSLGLGLAFLLFGGLIINYALPWFGIAQPLAKIPLVSFFGISGLLLAARIYFSKNIAIPSFAWRRPD